MIYWIWLSCIKGIGIQLQRALLDHFKDPQHIYFASKDDLMQVDGFGRDTVMTVLTNLQELMHLRLANKLYSKLLGQIILSLLQQQMDSLYLVVQLLILAIPLVIRLLSSAEHTIHSIQTFLFVTLTTFLRKQQNPQRQLSLQRFLQILTERLLFLQMTQ